MKTRLVTFLIVAAATLAAGATDYTDRLQVTVNGESSVQDATISVTEHDGRYDLNLKNFMLMNGTEPMPVGNVQLTDILPEKARDAIFLRANQNITVTAGDAAGVPNWMGPMLGELPVEVVAVLENDGLRALINIDLMSTLHQIVEVRFGDALVNGTGYHIPNGGFEDWHVVTGNYEEPNGWHSFESASGTLATWAGNHIKHNAEGGIEGTACAHIFATSIFGIVANGTMTTGRLNAGSMSAANTANNAYIDMSLTDVDANGDPFYTPLTAKPDSLVLWLQFHQGTANSAHPYASVSAIITDGTYYQDPEDKEYTNVVAKGKNNTIAVTGKEWRRVSIPFEYTNAGVEPRAILVTISTNADPGQGSANDEVLVDNLSLVYDAQPDSKGAYVLQSIVDGKPVVTVYSADLRSKNNFEIPLTIDDVMAVVSRVLGKEGPVPFDVNGDKHISIVDAALLLQLLIGR